ncbi:hypothetical protein JVT61DRAFT_13646 [Boletus reticuloceps]|uniref:Uncharacterized protein n=1 Tax=Boletus reticuloceps TaxID=495285 RepID=A0A8I2YD64_9AGAM|nr:hypothetical protein JVT61DRAFT_13646 [Boletus reticuloceps]
MPFVLSTPGTCISPSSGTGTEVSIPYANSILESDPFASLETHMSLSSGVGPEVSVPHTNLISASDLFGTTVSAGSSFTDLLFSNDWPFNDFDGSWGDFGDFATTLPQGLAILDAQPQPTSLNYVPPTAEDMVTPHTCSNMFTQPQLSLSRVPSPGMTGELALILGQTSSSSSHHFGTSAQPTSSFPPIEPNWIFPAPESSTGQTSPLPSDSCNHQPNIIAQPAQTIPFIDLNWNFPQAAPESLIPGQTTLASNSRDSPINIVAQPTPSLPPISPNWIFPQPSSESSMPGPTSSLPSNSPQTTTLPVTEAVTTEDFTLHGQSK